MQKAISARIHQRHTLRLGSILMLVFSMTLTTRSLSRRLPRSAYLRPFTSGSVFRKWEGRKADEHVVNREDELDVHSEASQSGMREREKDDPDHSQGTSEKDKGKHNERAEKDHPEAPKPVIGMNDEKGGVSVACLYVPPSRY